MQDSDSLNGASWYLLAAFISAAIAITALMFV